MGLAITPTLTLECIHSLALLQSQKIAHEALRGHEARHALRALRRDKFLRVERHATWQHQAQLVAVLVLPIAPGWSGSPPGASRRSRAMPIPRPPSRCPCSRSTSAKAKLFLNQTCWVLGSVHKEEVVVTGFTARVYIQLSSRVSNVMSQARSKRQVETAIN